jgi:pimeloyl-ACP methyl ester carboxylesterase
VIIPDQIGFGESSQPEHTDYSLRAQAERLQAFVNALDISCVHLGGSSMGGHIAATYAALFPDEVRSLWLLDPTGVWSAPKSIMQTVLSETGRNPLLVEKLEDFPLALRMLISNPPPYIPRSMLSVLAEPYLKNPALGEHILREIGADSIEERVSGLETPTLIVWGSEDKIVHVDGSRILSALMPRSQVIIMPQTGHLPIVENPLRCAQDYLRFREQLDTTKDT